MIKRSEWIALSALSLLFLAFMLNWAVKATVHSQKDVTVPDLTGKPLNEALEMLSSHNLGIKKEGAEFNDTVPAGTILRQTPASGAEVREGKIVRITVSQGGETVFAPELVGQSLRSVEIALRTNFLTLGEINERPSLKYEKDFVIAQDPAPRAILTKNALVHVTVSNGPPDDGTILMPDFVGRSWGEAESWAKQAGVEVQKIQDPSSPAPSGSITQQEIAPDSPLVPKQSVKLTVSAGSTSGAPGIPSPGAGRAFRFDVPQGESAKQYSFILMDSFGSREIWKGNLEPGSKHDLVLPKTTGPDARIRIFVNGILTEERKLQ